MRNLALRLAALAILVALAIAFLDLRAVLAALMRLPAWAFAAALGLEWLFFAIESWRIQLMSGRLYPFAPVFRSRLLSVLLGNFLPGFGMAEVARVFILDRARPGNKVFVALLFLGNRVYGVLALAPILAVGVAAARPGSEISRFMPPPLVVGIAAFAAVLSPLAFNWRPTRSLLACPRGWLGPRLRRVHRTIYRAGRSFCAPRLWAISLLLSLLTTSIAIAQVWVLAIGTRVPIGFFDWAIIVPLLALAVFLPIGIGAVGPQDAGLAIAAGLYRLPVEPLLGLSLALHAVRIAGSAPGAAFLRDLPRFDRRKP